MATAYWAQWATTGHIADLSDRILPHVLAEGYDLLTFNSTRQMFDRGGVLKKYPGRSMAATGPTRLSIFRSNTPTAHGKTVAEFRWTLAVRPMPATHKEQASFETWIRSQFSRIVAGIDDEARRGHLDQLRPARPCHRQEQSALRPLANPYRFRFRRS